MQRRERQEKGQCQTARIAVWARKSKEEKTHNGKDLILKSAKMASTNKLTRPDRALALRSQLLFVETRKSAERDKAASCQKGNPDILAETDAI